MRISNNILKFSSPLRYPGGKSKLFEFVSSLINENKGPDFASAYAEPYAGGSGLALKLLFSGVVNEIYLNDYDFKVFSFWDTILTNSDLFCNWLADVEITIENWQFYKEQINNLEHETKNKFELAKAFFFLNRCNVSGVIKGGVIGGQKQLGNYKIDSRFNKGNLIERIKFISQYSSKIHFYNLDAIDFLESIKKKNNIFTYLDPPYYQKGSKLYLNFYTENDHISLSSYLEDFGNDFILSYDYNDFIIGLYSDLDVYKFNISQSTSNRVGQELMIFSKNIKYNKSIKFLNNHSKIKNRQVVT